MNYFPHLIRATMVLGTATAFFVASEVDANTITYRWSAGSSASLSWDPGAAVQNPDPLSNGNATEYVPGTLVVDTGPFAGTYGAAVGQSGNIRVVDDNLNAGNTQDQFRMQFVAPNSPIVNFTRLDGAAWNTQSLSAVSDQLIPLDQWDTATIRFGDGTSGITEQDITSLVLAEQTPDQITYKLTLGIIGTISWDTDAAVQKPDPFGNGNATEYGLSH